MEKGTQLYTVREGDTLYTIGTKLVIPTPETTYVVKPGDNLYQIARKYGTTVDNIKALNNLTTNNLSVGQILVLR